MTVFLRTHGKLVSFLILLLLTVLIFLPMNQRMITSHAHNDFSDHISFARELSQGRAMPEHIEAHPAWQLSVFLAQKLLRISLENAAIIVQMIFQCALAAVLFFVFQRSIPEIKAYLLVILPLALMLVSQLMLFVFWDDLFYLGYVGMNTYHNPTIIALKPFAIILILFSIDLIKGEKFHWVMILLSAVMVILSTLIKPNLIICLLPAVGLFLLIRLTSRKPMDWYYTIFGLALPAILVLLWQFYVTFGTENAGILFDPFAVMKAFSEFLIPKFLLSIWFPGLVLIFYFKQVRIDPGMQLNWVIFIFGAVYTYLFAESGNRFLHANFGWSGEIALFTLFVYSLIFFFKQKGSLSPAKWRWILFLGFLPHVAAGVIYYLYTFTQNTFI